MAMLAEPRRKQKWALNPRGKQWSDDSNKFGQKMLEKMGWSSGKGLGSNLDGMTEHIRLRYKNDQAGVGYSLDDQDKEWTQHQEGFNELLQKLHNGDTTETRNKEKELSGTSLEMKSKQSRARVHYQKFTRGKDVNKYSTKDLANIFGKKEFEIKTENSEVNEYVDEKTEREESVPEATGSSDVSHGVVTIRGGSITDYFKNKMATLGRKAGNDASNDDKNDSGSERETYVGFGFAGSRIKSETPEKTKGNRNFSFENPGLDVESPKERIETPRKRKSDFVFENPALEIEDNSEEVERTPKRRRNDFAFENEGLDLEYSKDTKKTLTITKVEILKSSESPEGFRNSAVPTENLLASKKMNTDVVRCIGKISETREVLNLETNDAGILEINQFEIPRSRFGLANDALDLTDESSGKKRVTFNETVEYDTDVTSARHKKKKKNRNAGKLDKFEVDNEKLKRKKKKGKKMATDMEAGESSFVNEAMDVEITSQEANDNAVNERKSERARRKRDRRMSNLETIEEAPEEDKEPSVTETVTLDESLVGEASKDFEVLSLETPTKKKKRKKDKKVKIETADLENDSTSNDVVEDVKDIMVVDEIRFVNTKTATSCEKSEKNTKNDNSIETEMLEVESIEVIRKKSKKRKKEIAICEPEEMEVGDITEEIISDGKNDKMKKKMKNNKTMENMDKENIGIIPEYSEEIEIAKRRKKQKKDKKRNSIEIETSEEKVEEVVNENLSAEPIILDGELENVDIEWKVEGAKNHVELSNGSRSPWDSKARRSKKIFKALFARSPVVNFAGSNINEIRGYGMDMK